MKLRGSEQRYRNCTSFCSSVLLHPVKLRVFVSAILQEEDDILSITKKRIVSLNSITDDILSFFFFHRWMLLTATMKRIGSSYSRSNGR